MVTTYLQLLMKHKGLTQTKLSKNTGIAQYRIPLLCNGKSKIYGPEIEKLQKWFPSIPVELLLEDINEQD